MFQEPSRKKEGMNLNETNERKVKTCCKQVISLLLGSLSLVSVCLPFVERRRPFVSEHGESTAHCTAVLAGA